MKRILLSCLLGIAAIAVNAQQQEPEIARFDFQSSVAPSYTTSNVASTNVTINNSTGAIANSVTCNSNVFESGQYNPNVNALTFIQFTVYVDSGFQMDLTKISFNANRNSSGPQNGALRSNLDNFSSDLATYTFNVSNCNNYSSLLPVNHTGIRDSIVFRLYGYNSSQQSANNRKLYIDNLIINGIVTIIPGSPLPVEYLDLSARHDGAGVAVHWITALEYNNDHFIIEKSADGRNFTGIGRVEGAGNSTIEKEYNYYDDAPISTESFYRLKQVDYNGEYEYSKILMVRDHLKPYPFTLIRNGNNNQINFQITAVREESLRIEIIDINGKVVEKYVLPVQKGRNSYELPVSNLAAGAYFLTINGENGMIAEKFIK